MPKPKSRRMKAVRAWAVAPGGDVAVNGDTSLAVFLNRKYAARVWDGPKYVVRVEIREIGGKRGRKE